jgi:hypothetical protein
MFSDDQGDDSGYLNKLIAGLLSFLLMNWDERQRQKMDLCICSGRSCEIPHNFPDSYTFGKGLVSSAVLAHHPEIH